MSLGNVTSSTAGIDRHRPFGRGLLLLASESLVYGLSSIVGRLLSFLLQPYYAHYFDPSQNAIQSVVYSYVPILSIAFYLGMDVAYMRGAAATNNAPLRERQRAFSMAFGMVALVGGIIGGVTYTAAPWWAPLARLDVRSFRFMLAIVFTDAVLAVPYAHLRIANRSLRYAVLRLLFVGISISLNVVLIAQLHWGVESIFVANVVGNLAVLAVFAPEITRLFRPGLLLNATWRPLLAYALPILPATLAVMLVENGDRIVLNYLPAGVAHSVYGMTPKDVVGIYAFNYKLGVAMLLVVQMFRMAWTPFLLQHAGEPRAPQLFSRVLTGLMLACSAVFLAVTLYLPSIVRIPAVAHYIRPAYWAGLPIVPVILFGYVLSGVYAVVTGGLYVERKTHVLPWIAGTGALVNLAICLVAGWHWGIVGVAWATPAAYAVMAALGVWQSNRVYPVPFEWRRLGHLGAIVAAVFVADRWLAAHGVDAGSPSGIGAKAVLFAALPLMLIATRFFRRGEWQAARSLARALRF